MKDIRIYLLVFALLGSSVAQAQRKEISQARTIIKSKRGVEQAEKLMTTLLKDSLNRVNKRIYALWYESVLLQYQAVNEKLYMKQRQDTAQFFELTRRLFTVAEALDSLDMRPDKKGKVDIDYRKDNAEQLMKYRPNLFVAINYYIRKNDFKRAFEFSELYMDCARQPLFSEYHLDSLDRRMPEAAYWAVYSGFRQNDPVLTLRHRHLALTDSARQEATIQYMAEARQKLKDDSLYMETLRRGFRLNPLNPYFFSHLMDYYSSHGENDSALAVVDHSIATEEKQDGTKDGGKPSLLYLYAKSTVLFNMGRLDDCIAICDSLISRNDTMPEPYYNAGTAYLNKALRLHPLREKKALKATYQQALRYMERYRQLAPDQKEKWGPALYRIYLNLNMGQQFDEIDQLLK